MIQAKTNMYLQAQPRNKRSIQHHHEILLLASSIRLRWVFHALSIFWVVVPIILTSLFLFISFIWRTWLGFARLQNLGQKEVTRKRGHVSSRERRRFIRLREQRREAHTPKLLEDQINPLRRIPPTYHGLIRDIVVAAITVARKSHLNQVAAELKVALQLLRPHAAGEAQSTATQVLEKCGGYEGWMMRTTMLISMNSQQRQCWRREHRRWIRWGWNCIVALWWSQNDQCKCRGDKFADKSDWSDAIKDCKSVSRLAQ